MRACNKTGSIKQRIPSTKKYSPILGEYTLTRFINRGSVSRHQTYIGAFRSR